MPSVGCCTRPEAKSSVANGPKRLEGIAKFSPTLPLSPGGDAPAELMPTRSPEQSTKAPPLLPGLMEASVWMAPTRW